ncbi:hypothetical protein V6N11_056142 [Hibiscus sabdariffa]|uniref:Uncharacterized protein n=1 Tax=Hibiscus sabdariffa TaxID=183260 RepID=A0ABR2T2Y1_9ROSI
MSKAFPTERYSIEISASQGLCPFGEWPNIVQVNHACGGALEGASIHKANLEDSFPSSPSSALPASQEIVKSDNTTDSVFPEIRDVFHRSSRKYAFFMELQDKARTAKEKNVLEDLANEASLVIEKLAYSGVQEFRFY